MVGQSRDNHSVAKRSRCVVEKFDLLILSILLIRLFCPTAIELVSERTNGRVRLICSVTAESHYRDSTTVREDDSAIAIIL